MPVPSNRLRGKWSHILALCSSDRDFERKVLPFLKLHWPGLQQCPPKQHWDRHGIDLLAWADDGPFPCVVQCKGFIERTFGPDQLRQIRKSIASFRKSPYQCEVYIVAHNREISDRGLYDSIAADLSALVADQKALRAEMWDRQTILRRAEARLQEVLDESLRKESAALLDRFQSLFAFGSSYVPSIPVTEHDIVFNRDNTATTSLRRALSNRVVSDDLLQQSGHRWTLLTGRFGSGKTTTALHAAAAKDRIVFFVPCASLEGNIQTSLNEFLLHAAESLGLFDEFDPEDRAAVLDLAGPTLAHLLRMPNCPYILILDALDEQRAYCRPLGLGILSNQLAELTCSVVLTTRQEHYHALFGSFGVAFGQFSTKFGPSRSARVLTLESWADHDIGEFVRGAAESATDPRLRERLVELLELVENGAYQALYGELPQNPLLMQFILDDLAAGILQRSSQSDLLLRWVQRKLHRDVQAREAFFDGMDPLEIVQRACDLMAAAAGVMTETQDDVVMLCETISSDKLQQLANVHLNIHGAPLVDILLHSLLVPRAARQGKNLDIVFAFRIIQEYFLAHYLTQHHLGAAGYPETIRALHRELSTTDVG